MAVKKPFMFQTPQGKPFPYKLVVFATSLKKARRYVKNESIGSLWHRGLKYIGQGEPNRRDQCCWPAVMVN